MQHLTYVLITVANRIARSFGPALLYPAVYPLPHPHARTVILKADRTTAQTIDDRTKCGRAVDGHGLCGRVEVHWAGTTHNADRPTAYIILYFLMYFWCL